MHAHHTFELNLCKKVGIFDKPFRLYKLRHLLEPLKAKLNPKVLFQTLEHALFMSILTLCSS